MTGATGHSDPSRDEKRVRTPDDETLGLTKRLRRRTLIKQAATIAGVSTVAGYASLAPTQWPLSLRDPGTQTRIRCQDTHISNLMLTRGGESHANRFIKDNGCRISAF